MFLTIFYIFHKNSFKIYFKLFINNWPMVTYGTQL